MTRNALGGMALVLVFTTGAFAQTPVAVTGSGGTALVLNWKGADLEPQPARPGFPEGLENAQVATDPETGGITYVARFPAGATFDMHWHTYTETLVVVEGEVDVIIEGTRYTATQGSYIILPGRAHHEWQTPAHTGVVMLARRDGPPDFHFVEP